MAIYSFWYNLIIWIRSFADVRLLNLKTEPLFQTKVVRGIPDNRNTQDPKVGPRTQDPEGGYSTQDPGPKTFKEDPGPLKETQATGP